MIPMRTSATPQAVLGASDALLSPLICHRKEELARNGGLLLL